MQQFTETADIETASADYAARFSGPAGEFFLARQTEITLDLLKEYPQARILDVGGGHAQLAKPLVERGFDVTVTGSDERCRERLDQLMPAGGFSYLTCDSLDLPFPAESFDVVMAFRLLPHVTRWQELLGELCRVAGKCVILDYPDSRSTNILYRLMFSLKKKMEGNTRPFTLFTRGQLAGALTAHGFATPEFHPEFFLPMVVHRKMNTIGVSSTLEQGFATLGLTRLLGSPIILRSLRKL